MNLELNSLEEFCKKINVRINFLKYILYVKKDNYYEFEIFKKNGTKRKITAPKEELKYIQKQLLIFLEENYTFLKCQHGFIKTRSSITNAQNHVGKTYVLNCDIENFFDNIHFGRVRGMFMKRPFNFTSEIATTIAQIVCYKKKLPQGAPTSPIISNMICYKMDKDFENIAKKNNCTYTRYADDITFSTNRDPFPKEIAEIKDNNIIVSSMITTILNGGYNNGFKLNDEKTRLFKRYQRQEVTGIIVNTKTNVRKKYVKNIRAILHNIEKNGFINAFYKTFGFKCKDEREAEKKLLNYLVGKISYLKMVKSETDNIYLKYAQQLNHVFEKEIFDINDEIRVRKYAKSRCYVIESASGNGTGFSLIENEIITSTHVILDEYTYPQLIRKKTNSKFNSQFPISSNDMEFIYLKHPKLIRKKLISNFVLTKDNYETDICNLKVIIDKKNRMRLSQNKPKLGDTIYMVGYPSFQGFQKTDLHVIKSKIIGENEFLERKLYNTLDAPPHGMSGGPVLNSKREVIGIIYAGNDDEYNIENVGFIGLVK